MAKESVRRVQELRRSGAAGAVPSKKAYKRSSFESRMTMLRNEQFHIGEAPNGTPAGANGP